VFVRFVVVGVKVVEYLVDLCCSDLGVGVGDVNDCFLILMLY